MPLYGKEQDLPGFVILFCYSAAKNEFFRFLFYETTPSLSSPELRKYCEENGIEDEVLLQACN